MNKYKYVLTIDRNKYYYLTKASAMRGKRAFEKNPRYQGHKGVVRALPTGIRKK